jgi:hypothetical protein
MNLQIISAVLSITPKVIAVIRELEEIDSTSGKGAAKKALALKLVEAAYNATKPTIPFADIAAAISTTIDAAVEFFNSIGTFVKGLKK